MQKTEYLKLNKPDSTDFFSVDHQNQNMELIDAELEADKKEIENIKAESDKLNSDLSGKANSSHTHTKSEVGLGNVDNTADANKSVKYAASAGSAPANGGDSDTVNGHTVKSDVPDSAKFTDTWRGIQDNLTSESASDSLSANQGRILNNKLTELDNSKLKGYTVSYTVPANTGGWHKIADITGDYFNFDLYATGGWAMQRKSNAHFQIQNINGSVRIVQLSGISDPAGIGMIRMVRVVDNKNIWILEEKSISSSSNEIFMFTIAGDVIVNPLDGSVDTTTDFKDSVSLEVSNVPTGTVITTSNVDSALSSTSTHPVQNKVVKTALDDKANISIYGDTSVSLGRKSGTTIGTNSFAFGNDTTASGDYSHAEGFRIKAEGESSHAEGSSTSAEGDYSHAEGDSTSASGSNSHAEGYSTSASSVSSHAEGSNTTATKPSSHAEGYSTAANAYYSHAEGYSTLADGSSSHAEGYNTSATNYASHVGGKYNAAMSKGGTPGNKTGHVFVIGNGTSFSAQSNAFSVMYSGVVKAASTITASTTADYAEFFEWEDGNSDAEDRVGKFVTLNGDKISIATSNEDYILGIVSGEPFVLGNGDCDTWNGMYLRDEFGRTILEPAPKIEIDEETGEEKEFFDEDGNIIYEGTRSVLNPDYDPTQPYISRFDRPEWSPVGMLGVLSVIQDGTCKVNGYCCCNSEGIATSCDRNTEGACRIIEVINDKVARVIFR